MMVPCLWSHASPQVAEDVPAPSALSPCSPLSCPDRTQLGLSGPESFKKDLYMSCQSCCPSAACSLLVLLSTSSPRLLPRPLSAPAACYTPLSLY